MQTSRSATLIRANGWAVAPVNVEFSSISPPALAVMLVIGAGLLIRTVYNLTNVDAGFDRSRLVTFSMTLAEPYEPDTRAHGYRRLLDKLRVAPGVQGAAVMSGLPPTRSPEAISTRIENHTASDGSPVEIIDYYQFVMGDYFQTMGVPIVAGRSFEPADAVSPSRVVIVNETLANRIWKGRNPIGQRVRPNLSAAIGFGGNSWHTVIGVAKDVKQGGVEKETGTELYVSLDQLAMAAPTMNVVLRTTLPPAVTELDDWMAAGAAELLRSLPENHPRRARILAGYRKMMAALLAAQDKDGFWHQLIDKPDSWPETSGSAMFTFAFVAGVKHGWLEEKTYGPAARKAWLALMGSAERGYRDAGGHTNTANPADPYMTVLGYFNSLRELGGARRILEERLEFERLITELVKAFVSVSGDQLDAEIQRGLEQLDKERASAARYRELQESVKRLRGLMAWRRGAAMDGTSPVCGDILLYQCRGQQIQALIRRRIEEVAPPVIVVAHSLGGVAAVDLLVGEKLDDRVRMLVTVGSQAPYFYEINALQSLEYARGEGLPGHFPSWINVYDLRDFLSFVGGELFPGRVVDRCVNNRQPFPDSHSAYFWNADFYPILADAIRTVS